MSPIHPDAARFEGLLLSKNHPLSKIWGMLQQYVREQTQGHKPGATKHSGITLQNVPGSARMHQAALPGSARILSASLDSVHALRQVGMGQCYAQGAHVEAHDLRARQGLDHLLPILERTK